MGIVKDSLYRLSSRYFLSAFKQQTLFPYYHIVRDNAVAHIENLYEFKNVDQFKKDIQLLKKYYNPIDPKVLLRGERPVNSFLLTFDDGLSEIYSEIYPILKQENISAVFFINPDFVGNEKSLYKHDISVAIATIRQNGFERLKLDQIAKIFHFDYTSNEEFIQKFKSISFAQRHGLSLALKVLGLDMGAYLLDKKPYITKPQIQEMIDAGFYFGGHTMSHPPLNQLEYEDQKEEIIDSMQWLKDHFGIQYSTFAFPFSDKNISRKLLEDLFEYDEDIVVFGNSGLKKDFDARIIQRFSLENPNRESRKLIVTENLYKIFNRFTGTYNIKRK